MPDTTPYIYLFVREDLSKPQQIIQAAHAVDELSQWHNLKPLGRVPNHMCLIGVTGESQLLHTASVLDKRGIQYHAFWESDINQHTAIATVPLAGDQRKALREFRTMR